LEYIRKFPVCYRTRNMYKFFKNSKALVVIFPRFLSTVKDAQMVHRAQRASPASRVNFIYNVEDSHFFISVDVWFHPFKL
jgi:hypothetical protein